MCGALGYSGRSWIAVAHERETHQQNENEFWVTPPRRIQETFRFLA